MIFISLAVVRYIMHIFMNSRVLSEGTGKRIALEEIGEILGNIANGSLPNTKEGENRNLTWTLYVPIIRGKTIK